mmetsp:Transcript_5246/g.18620  ORF Transcript_5246/g.18620 Transcript_5246/m.18620 type:complete len:256 (-) Transcript_5246:3122-3889(-)
MRLLRRRRSLRHGRQTAGSAPLERGRRSGPRLAPRNGRGQSALEAQRPRRNGRAVRGACPRSCGGDGVESDVRSDHSTSAAPISRDMAPRRPRHDAPLAATRRIRRFLGGARGCAGARRGGRALCARPRPIRHWLSHGRIARGLVSRWRGRLAGVGGGRGGARRGRQGAAVKVRPGPAEGVDLRPVRFAVAQTRRSSRRVAPRGGAPVSLAGGEPRFILGRRDGRAPKVARPRRRRPDIGARRPHRVARGGPGSV